MRASGVVEAFYAPEDRLVKVAVRHGKVRRSRQSFRERMVRAAEAPGVCLAVVAAWALCQVLPA